MKSCLYCIIRYVLIILTTVFHLLSFQAKESIDQLVYLCRTDKEEVRDAAKQALLVLGNNNYHISLTARQYNSWINCWAGYKKQKTEEEVVVIILLYC